MHNAAPFRLVRDDGRYGLVVAFALAVLGIAFLFDRWRRSDMSRIITALALAGAATLLVGCNGAGRVIVGKLPDYEIRHKPAIPCSEMLRRVDPEQRLANAQQRAVLEVCEQMTKGLVVTPAELLNSMRLTVPSPF